MPQITLNRKDLDTFADFLNKHGLDKFFLAKDDGAYIGATAGSHEDGNFERCIFYFAGCDPKKDEFCWENARDKFGGDDFGEHLEADVVKKAAADPLTTKLVVNVTASSISIKSYARKAAPKAPVNPAAEGIAAAKAEANEKPMKKGERIRALLAEGHPVDFIVKVVGTTANSVRWHKSKMKAA